MRFNPPPNWPPAPPGWEPEPGWTPDPSWPPPPPGWQLWVEVPDYPVQPAQYLPYPGQWPTQPAPGSRKLWWIALAAAVAAIAVVAGLTVTFGGRATDLADKPSRKSDITELTSDLLVGRSAFPEISGGKWISGVNSTATAPTNLPNLTTDPPECGDLYGDSKSATQTATATLANLQAGGLHSMRVHLAITPEQRNLKEYVHKCQSFTQSLETAGRNVTTEVRLDPLDAADVPPWAVATVTKSSSSTAVRLSMSVTAATVSGYYRGVLVVASSNDIRLQKKRDETVDTDNAADLVKLFNEQIEKLEAAP